MTMVEPGATLESPGTGDVTAPSSGGGGIQSWSPGKKILILGGGSMGFLALIYLYARSKKNSSTTSSTTSSNSTTPTLVLPTSNQDAVGGSDYASLTEGLNNLGNQVSQLQSTQTNVGGSGGVSQPTQPAPNVPSNLLSAIPGQTVVSEQWDPAFKDWIVLTNKGGIFNIDGSGKPAPGYFGNPLADPNGDNWRNSSGQFVRTAQQLTVRPSGGYTIEDTAGENYNYGPA